MESLNHEKKLKLMKALKAKRKAEANAEKNSTSDRKLSNGSKLSKDASVDQSVDNKVLKKPISKPQNDKPSTAPIVMGSTQFQKLLYTTEKLNSPAISQNLFAWMIHPITTQSFYQNYYQQKP